MPAVTPSARPFDPTCATCRPPAGPEVPQTPVPVPATPPPDWSQQVFAAIIGASGRSAALAVDGEVGEIDGYATWVEATAAARSLSSSLGRAVAIMDHDGRLYLRTLHVPAGFPFVGMGRTYVMGQLGERAVDFAGPAMRGIAQGPVVLTRGDCLVPRVLMRPLGR